MIRKYLNTPHNKRSGKKKKFIWVMESKDTMLKIIIKKRAIIPQRALKKELRQFEKPKN